MLILTGLALPVSAFNTTTINIFPESDTTIASFANTTNYDDALWIFTYEESSIESTVLARWNFTTIPANQSIVDAKIYLFIANNMGCTHLADSCVLHARELTESYISSGVTWATRPTYGIIVSELNIDWNDFDTQPWYAIDVTDVVGTWLDPNNPNYPTDNNGLELYITSDTGFARLVARSNDYTEQQYHPYMQVTYGDTVVLSPDKLAYKITDSINVTAYHRTKDTQVKLFYLGEGDESNVLYASTLITANNTTYYMHFYVADNTKMGRYMVKMYDDSGIPVDDGTVYFTIYDKYFTLSKGGVIIDNSLLGMASQLITGLIYDPDVNQDGNYDDAEYMILGVKSLPIVITLICISIIGGLWVIINRRTKRN